MKKIFSYIICLYLILNMSMTVSAQETWHKVGDGYTTDGIYYEVFVIDNLENESISMCNTSITVTREIRFSGEITPPRELSLNETIKGVNYSGTVKLKNYSYVSGITVATYTGTLYAD